MSSPCAWALASSLLAAAAAGAGAARPELDLLSREVFSGNHSREGRIFSFSKKPSSIRVELAFAIPFLSIPVGKGEGAGAGKGLVDINLGALASAGIFSVAAMLFIPHLFKGLSPEISFARAQENSGMSAVLSRMDAILREQNVDAGACAQRAVCSVVASSLANARAGAGDSIDKIVDGVVSANWLDRMVKGTFMQEAIQNARHGANCTHIYSSCPLSKKKLKNVATNLTKFIYHPGSDKAK